MENVDEILQGLMVTPKSIPSKFFYDEEGSRLFDEITKLDEYYITRCEKEILYHNADLFLNLYQDIPINIIELGPGDGSKASLLMTPLFKTKKKFEYHAVDISPRELLKLTHVLKNKFPALPVRTLVADYMAGVSKIFSQNQHCQNIVVFLGSSIGNMSSQESHNFITQLAAQLKPHDYLVIGFDLKKEERILWRAYNDTKGLTADFNLNLLNRLNREFGANFDLDKFKHFEIYNPAANAMESYLISQERQIVSFDENNLEITFDAEETIHTENSFKYDRKSILELIKDTGLTTEHFLLDKKNYVTIGIFKPLLRH